VEPHPAPTLEAPEVNGFVLGTRFVRDDTTKSLEMEIKELSS
jgi:hypothetical protein